MTEREELRVGQAERVMPLIGGLVDAWGGMFYDGQVELEEIAPSLVRAIKAIYAAQAESMLKASLPKIVRG